MDIHHAYCSEFGAMLVRLFKQEIKYRRAFNSLFAIMPVVDEDAGSGLSYFDPIGSVSFETEISTRLGEVYLLKNKVASWYQTLQQEVDLYLASLQTNIKLKQPDQHSLKPEMVKIGQLYLDYLEQNRLASQHQAEFVRICSDLKTNTLSAMQEAQYKMSEHNQAAKVLYRELQSEIFGHLGISPTEQAVEMWLDALPKL